LTDLEKLKALLDSWEVEYKEVEQEAGDYWDDSIVPKIRKCILLKQGDKKITGYCNFFVAFEFSTEGKFITVGAWE